LISWATERLDSAQGERWNRLGEGGGVPVESELAPQLAEDLRLRFDPA
jgi:hypothetical protein